MSPITRDQYFARGISRAKLRAMKDIVARSAFIAVCIILLVYNSIRLFMSGGFLGLLGLLLGTFGTTILAGILSGQLRGIRDPIRRITRDGLRRYEDTPTWVAEIDHLPKATTEWDREFVTVGADGRTEAIEAVREDHCRAGSSIVHLRQLDYSFYQLSHGECAEQYSTPWVDERDDPTKIYITPLVSPGFSYYSPAPRDDTQDIICHSLAGIGASAWSKSRQRTIPELIAMHEIHELVHWACEHGKDDWGSMPDVDESAWDHILWDEIDYVQGEQPDGPWYHDEERSRIEGTRGHSIKDGAFRVVEGGVPKNEPTQATHSELPQD